MTPPYYYRSPHFSEAAQMTCHQNNDKSLDDLVLRIAGRENAYRESYSKIYYEMIVHVYWDGIVIQFIDYTIYLRPELNLFYNDHLSASDIV